MTPNFRILTSVLLAALAAAASEPVEWTAKPGDGPKSFVRHHGSTLEFKCAFAGFGGAFAEASDVRLWYQTNGMGRAWWSVPATRSNEVLSASWPPSMDPGADRVSFFFGAPSNAYASAVVRLQHSPGFAPNVLTPPVSTLDFDAIEVQNPPYWTRAESDARYGGSSITASVVTNVAEAVAARDSYARVDGVSLDSNGMYYHYSGSSDSYANFGFSSNGELGMSAWNDAGWFNASIGGIYYGETSSEAQRLSTMLYATDGRCGYITTDDHLESMLLPYAASAIVASNALPRTEAVQTYATQTALGGKLDAESGTATKLEIGSMKLGQYGDLFEYRINFDDTVYSTYLAMPGCAWSLGLILPTYETQDEPEWTWEERRVLASRPWTSATCASKSDLSALSARVESDHRDSMYTMTSATAYTARTNSVQYIDLTGLGTLTISPPPAVQGRVRDWLVYVFAEADKTDALTFGDFASLLATDASATNRTLKAGVTMFAFSEIASGRFVVGRQELTDVTPAQ